MADQGYYDDTGEDTAAPGSPADDTASEATEPKDNETSEGETALLSDSMFPPECKVGDSYTIKVVAQHKGEKEISLVKKGEESPAPEPPPEDMPMRDKIMAAAA